MKSHDYIPTKDAAFFEFQKNFLLNLKDNLIKWNIPSQSYADLLVFADAFALAYQKSKNILTRTKPANKAHRDKRKEYVKALRNFIQQWVARNTSISGGELTGLGLKQRKQNHTRKGHISGVPAVYMDTIHGGRTQVKCWQETLSGRPSLHPLCHAVELKYAFGTDFPVAVEDCPNTYVITKAFFTIQFPMKEIRNFIYVYARWRNLSDDARSGPWCEMIRKVVG